MDLVQIRSRSSSSPGSSVEGRSESVPVQPLVDGFSRQVRYLRVSLTDRCNLRCTYCMPDDGIEHRPRASIASFEEIEQIVASFVAMGVTRVRLTGGEPTVRRGVVDLVARLSKLQTPDGDAIELVMTTNGTRLQELAVPLAAAGLSGITVSVDTLQADRFARITRRDELGSVLAGIAAARDAGLGPIRINTVAVDGFNDDELADLCRFAWAADGVPRFIELMPMAAGRLFVPGELLPAARARALIAEALGAAVVDDAGDGVRGAGPARYHRIVGGEFDGRRFGTIAAMTENFCDSCNRLRVDASGRMHACLARDDSGDLREAFRVGGPDALAATVRSLLAGKRERHGFELDGSGGPDRAMISIGG